jgi:hypothetical protein
VNPDQTRRLRRHRNSFRRGCGEDEALTEAKSYKSNEQRNQRKEHVPNAFIKFAQQKKRKPWKKKEDNQEYNMSNILHRPYRLEQDTASELKVDKQIKSCRMLSMSQDLTLC